MSRAQTGPLAAYNSLTDKHLTGYFNNTRVRKHLQRVGLVTRNGRIVSEKEYRLNVVRRDHQKYVRESLAQAVFHKVLNMEHLHQQEIRRCMEDLSCRDRIQRFKGERTRRPDDDRVPLLSPRPPAVSRNCHRSLSGPNTGQPGPGSTAASPRPSTAPGEMERPLRLVSLSVSGGPSGAVTGSHPSPASRPREQRGVDPRARPPHPPERESVRHWQTMEFPGGPSPYRLPVINNFVTPAPPPVRPWDRGGFTRGRRLRPTTAPQAPHTLPKEGALRRRAGPGQCPVTVTMVYRGQRLHLADHRAHSRDEVKVQQQHCGGENLCVFAGNLLPGERFELQSRRHPGFPFSLTLYVKGLQVARVSSCCEYRHRRGARLGGRRPLFTILAVHGAAPCYRCIIAAGLDKKPSPPPRRGKGAGGPGRESGQRGPELPRVQQPRSGALKAAEPVPASPPALSEDGMDRDPQEEETSAVPEQGEYADDFEEEPRGDAESESRSQSREEAACEADTAGGSDQERERGPSRQRRSLDSGSSASESEAGAYSSRSRSRSSSPAGPRSSGESGSEGSVSSAAEVDEEAAAVAEAAVTAEAGGEDSVAGTNEAAAAAEEEKLTRDGQEPRTGEDSGQTGAASSGGGGEGAAGGADSLDPCGSGPSRSE